MKVHGSGVPPLVRVRARKLLSILAIIRKLIFQLRLHLEIELGKR